MIPPADPSAPEATRLSRQVAEQARCSRADAEHYIRGGWVKVDTVVVEEPQTMITATQLVEIDPDAQLAATEPATMLLHKPLGVAFDTAAALVTPDTRAAGDLSGVRPLQRHFQRLTALMPLDTDASGLVVLSQDGRVWRRLSEDFDGIEQEFVVEVSGATGPYTLSRLARGLNYQGRVLPACKVSWQNEVRLRFAIKAVQPGQLRDMCAQVGLNVVAIKRIRIGRVSLGKMPAPEWRYLPVGERF